MNEYLEYVKKVNAAKTLYNSYYEDAEKETALKCAPTCFTRNKVLGYGTLILLMLAVSPIEPLLFVLWLVLVIQFIRWIMHEFKYYNIWKRELELSNERFCADHPEESDILEAEALFRRK
jgi:hypothetical protein